MAARPQCGVRRRAGRLTPREIGVRPPPGQAVARRSLRVDARVPDRAASADMTGPSELSRTARSLAAVLEPVIGQVYFAPECHAAYEALGFDGSPAERRGVALPDGPAYFASRGSLLGQVPGEVVAAAFGVFDPRIVVPAVTLAWSRTDATTIRAARAAGAVAQLRRLLGDRPSGVDRALDLLLRATDGLPIAGRPLAAGVLAGEVPDEPLAAVWSLGDLVRELRGGSHTAAWVAAGLTATEIGLLTDRYRGLPLRGYSRTRGWTPERFEVAEASLRERELLEADDLTAAGRELREGIEVATDHQMTPLLSRLADDATELIGILRPWGERIRAGHGYPAAGPHDVSGS